MTCLGTTKESENCNSRCPVHGGFTEWTRWSECSLTCGGGQQVRSRKCSNPVPRHHGLNCVGAFTEEKACAMEHCPINGEWSKWSDASACDKPCNGGSFIKRRYCNNPRPIYGGRNCNGSSIQRQPCNNFTCEEIDVVVYCKFKKKYFAGYIYHRSAEYIAFQKGLSDQLQVTVGIKFPNDLTKVNVMELKNGSVDAHFGVTFKSLDSYQLVYLQDIIETDLAIGKFPIVYNSTVEYIPVKVPTSPPTNIIITSNSPTSLNISWSEVPENSRNENVTGYLILYREQLEMTDHYEVFASYGYWEEVEGLKPGTSYVVRLLAYNENGNGLASHVIEASTLGMAPTSPPTALETTANEFSIFVQWSGIKLQDVNGQPLGYRIYFRDLLNTSFQLRTVPFTQPHMTVTDLRPSVTYVIIVAAYNEFGEGPQETTAATTLKAAPMLPPTTLNVTFRSHDKLILNWTSHSQDFDGYFLQYRIVRQNGVDMNDSVWHERKYAAAVLSEVLINLEANTQYMFSLAVYNQHGYGPSISINSETCKCRQKFYSNYYIKAPYVFRTSTKNTGELNGIFPIIIKDMINKVCGSCPGLYRETVVDFCKNGKMGFAGKQNIDRVTEDIDNFTDISFPMSHNPINEVKAKAEFIPIIAYPEAIFIIKEKTLVERVKNMMKRIFGIWTILFIDFMFILIAGGIIWFLEKWANKGDDFSMMGSHGVKQGFYWAYVTQTTVGYGDFTPRSKRARLFAIAWMVVSTITWSLLTGALTTAFTSVEVNEVNSIYGKQVAALYGSVEERICVLRNGKLDKNVKYTSVQHLVDALMSGDTSGILLDAYTAGREKTLLESHPVRAIFSIKYPRTYGIVVTSDLVNLKNDIEGYIVANQALILQTLGELTQKMQPKAPKEHKSLFSAESIFLRHAIIVLFVGLLFAAVLGLVVSHLRRKSKKITIYPEETVRSMLWKLDIDALRKFCKDFHFKYMLKINELYKRIELQRIKLFYDRGASSLRVYDQQIEERKRKRQREKQMKRKRKVGRVYLTDPVTIESESETESYKLPSRKLTYTIRDNLRLRKISHDSYKFLVEDVPLSNMEEGSSKAISKERGKSERVHRKRSPAEIENTNNSGNSCKIIEEKVPHLLILEEKTLKVTRKKTEKSEKVHRKRSGVEIENTKNSGNSCKIIEEKVPPLPILEEKTPKITRQKVHRKRNRVEDKLNIELKVISVENIGSVHSSKSKEENPIIGERNLKSPRKKPGKSEKPHRKRNPVEKKLNMDLKVSNENTDDTRIRSSKVVKENTLSLPITEEKTLKVPRSETGKTTSAHRRRNRVEARSTMQSRAPGNENTDSNVPRSLSTADLYEAMSEFNERHRDEDHLHKSITAEATKSPRKTNTNHTRSPKVTKR